MVEQEAVEGALSLEEEIEELVRQDLADVVAGDGDRDAEGHARLAQVGHGLQRAVEHARSAAGVGAAAHALDRYGGRQVAQPGQAVRRLPIDQRAVGEHQVQAVAVSLDRVEEVPALRAVHEGFAPGEDEQAHAPQRLSLGHDAVERGPGQSGAPRCGSRGRVGIATPAAQVAAVVGADGDEPGRVAAVFGPEALDGGGARGREGEVQRLSPQPRDHPRHARSEGAPLDQPIHGVEHGARDQPVLSPDLAPTRREPRRRV